MTQRTTLAVRWHSIFMLLTLFVASTFAQDTAYVPFKVNVDATVKAQQGEKSVSKNFTANTADTLLIVSEIPSLVSPGRTPKPVAMHSSRGRLTLELSSQLYKSAEISLYSLNGKRVLHDKASASEAAKNISHPNIATGVYLLRVKLDGDAFATSLAHHGGGMNIDVAFGKASRLKKEEGLAFGDWDITVSATGYFDFAYTLSPVIGINETQNITLRNRCGDAEYNSETEFCQEGTNEVLPLCNGETYTSSKFCINDVLLDIHSNCVNFKNGTAREHQGRNKAQFCDVRDGTKYVYVDIGNQTWMAENLNYSGEDGNMGRCAQGKDENCEAYGKLYTLDEMFCSGGDCDLLQWGIANPNDHSVNIACPIGWHLPSTTEYEALWTYSDPNFVPGSEASGTGRNTAATKLKVADWGTGAGVSTDELGFSGLPGGYCGSGCSSTVTGTQLFGSASFWWSHAYGAPVPLAKSWRMNATAASVDDAFQSYSTSAFYVRCLKDKTASPKTPEPAPQTLACSGNGDAGQRCHYGKWKDYFKDSRDNKEYPSVEIGGKTWMAANLNYSDGGTIGKCYNDLDANCDIYGRLYNYEAAVSTSDKVCPDNWHLPTDAEWTALMAAVGGTGTNNLVGATAKLKAKSGWGNIASANGTLGTDGTDDFGFSALPGGYGNLRAGNYGSIVNFGSARGGFWWSAGSVAANGAQIRHIGPTLNDVVRIDNDKSRMYSVRCVRDD